MLKPSTRKIVTKPATDKAAKTAVAKTATAARAAIDANPANKRLSPETKTILADAGLVTVPTVAQIAAVAKPSANITRTAATVVRQATNFAVLSDRDSAYLSFYAGLAKANATGTVTLAGIVASGNRPNYNGSNKPHDAGVIVRLTKAGLLQPGIDGHGFQFSSTGKTHGAYTAAKAS